MKKWIVNLLAFVMVVTAVPLVFSTVASAGCQATSWNWGNNCSVTTADRNWSELARGAQRGIRATGSGLVADGIFGANTEAKIKQFQTNNGLVSDGHVGPQTWAALYNELHVVGGNQQFTQFADRNNQHVLTWKHHHGREWTIKKWNSGNWNFMNDGWAG